MANFVFVTTFRNHIVDVYTVMLDSLTIENKVALLNRLKASIDLGSQVKDNEFYASFGGLQSELTAEEMISDIKLARIFKKREADF